MVVSENLKRAIVAELQRRSPLINIEGVKGEMLDWLAQLKFPYNHSCNQWEDCLSVFPPTQEEIDLESGLRIRLSLRLRTRLNKYLISVLECLTPSARGTYIICCHMGWREKERQLQQLVEETYMGSFADVLKARQAIWVQTFHEGELVLALDCCARAMLGEELIGDLEPDDVDGEPLSVRPPMKMDIPERAD
ncbi:MAG TPA: hypothetical protein PLF13_06015 [candidate division Zixibacteria bacterium]|nr:hypothetical protein [candidate division Zixibacteria bacterium]